MQGAKKLPKMSSSTHHYGKPIFSVDGLVLTAAQILLPLLNHISILGRNRSAAYIRQEKKCTAILTFS